jgi:hypothetical protein
MDLALYAQIFRRRWRLFTSGLILAILLSLLAYVRVGSDGIHYREQETWQTNAITFVTQEGFPWGRAYEQYLSGNPGKGVPPVPLGDNSRLSYLAMLYAQLANGDIVQNSIFHGPPDSSRSVVASAVVPASAPSGTVLPLLQLQATAPTKREAVDLAHRATRAFTSYLVHRQQAAAIGPGERVVVQPLSSGDDAKRISGRGKTVPILIFLAVMVGVAGLLFVLENVRPKLVEAAGSGVEGPVAGAAVGGGAAAAAGGSRPEASVDRLEAGADGGEASAAAGSEGAAGEDARSVARARRPPREPGSPTRKPVA